MMDWGMIITGVLSALGGGAISGFIIKMVTLQSTRDLATAEAEGKELENESAAIATLEKALQVMEGQLNRMNELLKEKDEKIHERNATIEKNVIKLTTLYDDMCIHKGCKLRMPHQGQGSKWYEEHKGDPSLGCDFTPVETLLKIYNKNEKNEVV